MDETAYILYDEDKLLDDDLLRVLEIYDEDGEEIPLNNRRLLTSIFTPSYDILNMTPDVPTEYRTIVYQASHPKIVVTDGYFLPLPIL
jgi:hypothetical protein